MASLEPKIKSILIANRGEIACRIIRTTRELGIKTIAIYSDQDKGSLHTECADESYPLGGTTAFGTYLDQNKIIKICKQSRANAIHPGYGFLSENFDFVRELEQNKICFIGPTSRALQALGNKRFAKELAKKLKIPISPGFYLTNRELEKIIANSKVARDEFLSKTKTIGYPIVIKAAAGGGGRGMRIVRKASELMEMLHSAHREAIASFGNGELFVEKLIENARHIEVQILGDKFGNVAHLFDRDCSMQRNNQKLIEEAPAPGLSKTLRNSIYNAAIKLAKTAKYHNAGTVEFLVDKKEKFYFLEVNGRLQVEHPVTEAITGVDLVAAQIRVSNGEKISSIIPESLKMEGSAIECRICAEIPVKGFAPSTGKIENIFIPDDKMIRIDTGVRKGDSVSTQYDSMIAKVIAKGSNRDSALETMSSTLANTFLSGISSNIGFLGFLIATNEFKECRFHSKSAETFLPAYLDNYKKLKKDALRYAPSAQAKADSLLGNTVAIWNSQDAFRLCHTESQNFHLIIDDSVPESFNFGNEIFREMKFEKSSTCPGIYSVNNHPGVFASFSNNQIWLKIENEIFSLRKSNQMESRHKGSEKLDQVIKASLPGIITRVSIKPKQEVNEGDELLILESMKLEHIIRAPRKCKISTVLVQSGQKVESRQELIHLVD